MRGTGRGNLTEGVVTTSGEAGRAGSGASSRVARDGHSTAEEREPARVNALRSREERGEWVTPQIDNLPNEHGGRSISRFGCRHRA